MQQVVEEPVLAVPHVVVVVAHAIHGVRDPEEMLEEPVGDLLVHRIRLAEDERDLQHVLAVERHPRRAVRLVEMATGRQLGAAIEHADVVQPEEAAGKHVAPLRVLAVHPPVEVLHQALERSLEEAHVRPAELFLDVVEEQRGPRVHRRIDVAEVPLVRRDLTVGMRVEDLSINRSCSLAKSKSTSESDKVWNARSQAAYHGYSHLSGIEMMSLFSM